MKPSDLVSLGNARRNYGDLSELLASIQFAGIQKPIVYYVKEDMNVIWDGHRRLRCVQILKEILTGRTQNPDATGADIYPSLSLDNAALSIFTIADLPGRDFDDVPVTKRAAPKNPAGVIEFQLICAADGLRNSLNPIEEARAMMTLIGMGKKLSYVASILGKSEAYVSRRSRLVNLHPDFKKAIESGDLSPRAAEEILTLEDASNEQLRQSIIGAKTQRRIKAKVAAANTAQQMKQQPALMKEAEMGVDDPLILLHREELNIAIREAGVALKKAEGLYEAVDVKPDLNELKGVATWLL